MRVHSDDAAYQAVCALTSARAIVTAIDAHKAAFGIAVGVQEVLATAVNAMMLDACPDKLMHDSEVARARDLLQLSIKEFRR